MVVTTYNQAFKMAASLQQEGVWFHSMSTGAAPGNLTERKCFTGKLDYKRLNLAFENVIQSHSSLRTKFVVDNGKLFQVIHATPDYHPAFTHEVFGEIPVVEIEELVKAEALYEENYRFDFSNELLVRLKVMEFTNMSCLILTVSHLIADNVSQEILWNDLVRNYNDLLAGKIISPEGHGQYYEYCISQANQVTTDNFNPKRRYWADKFNREVPDLGLQFHKPSLTYSVADVHIIEASVPAGLASELRAFLQQKEMMPSSFFLTAYFLLLHQYTGKETIFVGSMTDGRSFKRRSHKNTVGLFAQRLVNVLDFDANDTLQTLLVKVNDDLISSFDNSDIPYETVLKDFRAASGSASATLFGAVFNYREGRDIKDVFDGTTLDEQLSGNNSHANNTEFYIGLSVCDDGEAIKVRLDVRVDAVFREVVDLMVQRYLLILSELVHNSSAAISNLRHPADETNRLLNIFNDSSRDYPKDLTIVDLLHIQMERRSAATAIAFEGKTMSYGELDERSLKLAHHLRQCGVKEESLVAICFERSIEMIVGIIAILRSGGAYVPIDPDYPQDRVNYMLEDSAAKVVLTSKRSKSALSDYKGKVILLDDEWQEIQNRPATPLNVDHHPGHLAYIIYTSGSTGRPKGVMIEHRHVVRLFETATPLYDFNEGDVWTMFHSASFDFSVWEIFGALFYGGKLVIAPRWKCQDAMAFADLLVSENVTVLNQTPSAFYVLQDCVVPAGKKLKVRYVIFGGEALEFVNIKKWHAKYRDCKMINMYGITETTVHVTYQEISSEMLDGHRSLIGNCIPTLQAYILDDNQRLLPMGVTGELCVGGTGLARGYLNQVDMTAKRFVDHPFCEGEKVYRSGDLARWLPNGTMEYLGRMDHQVKIRGYRIELGEIESVILKSEQVKQAVVIPREDKSGVKYLVGHVVPAENYDQQSMITFLRTRLPSYMIPAVWTTLDNMPLSSNGKTDRKRLQSMPLDNL